MKRLSLAKSQCNSIKLHAAIALFAILLIPGIGLAQAAEEEKKLRVNYSFETDFNSRYVWRGLAASEGAVEQSTAKVTINSLTFYAWGNRDLDRGLRRGEFNEIDFGASYAREWKKLIVEPAFDYYQYRSPVENPSTGEASLKLSYPAGRFRAFIKHSFDVLSYRGAYFGEAGLAYESRLGDSGVKRKMIVASTVTLGWASAKFNEAYIGASKPALNVAGARVALTWTPNRRLYLRPHFEFSHIADRRLRGHLTSPTIGNFGFAAGVNF